MFKKKKSKPLPLHPVDYPAGICVRTPLGAFLVNKDGKRYRITTERVLASWNFPIVVETTDAAISHFPIAVTKLGFRDGTLLKDFGDGKVYLVSGSVLRHVLNPDRIEEYGLGEPVVCSSDEIKIMKQGDPII